MSDNYFGYTYALLPETADEWPWLIVFCTPDHVDVHADNYEPSAILGHVEALKVYAHLRHEATIYKHRSVNRISYDQFNALCGYLIMTVPENRDAKALNDAAKHLKIETVFVKKE